MIIVFLLWLVSFWPLIIFSGIVLVEFLLLLSVFVIGVSIISWSAFQINYEFYPDYLLVKGGPFVSRIPYDKITSVTLSNNIFSGYRVLSSRDAIEIFYKHALWGSVTIAPDYKKEFLHELTKRCPHAEMRV
ncbi:PH domain-containing protein [Terribacillus halophilus]|nr:PH domain-containing protein [Terribacillus halophilus]